MTTPLHETATTCLAALHETADALTSAHKAHASATAAMRKARRNYDAMQTWFLHKTTQYATGKNAEARKLEVEAALEQSLHQEGTELYFLRQVLDECDAELLLTQTELEAAKTEWQTARAEAALLAALLTAN